MQNRINLCLVISIFITRRKKNYLLPKNQREHWTYVGWKKRNFIPVQLVPSLTDSIELIRTTYVPETFFNRYGLAYERAKAINFDKSILIEGKNGEEIILYAV